MVRGGKVAESGILAESHSHRPSVQEGILLSPGEAGKIMCQLSQPWIHWGHTGQPSIFGKKAGPSRVSGTAHFLLHAQHFKHLNICHPFEGSGADSLFYLANVGPLLTSGQALSLRPEIKKTNQSCRSRARQQIILENSVVNAGSMGARGQERGPRSAEGRESVLQRD